MIHPMARVWSKLQKSILIVFLLGLSVSCQELIQVAEQMGTPRPLSQQEVVSGLKQALTIGADSAASGLAAVDGYYGDPGVRIRLPAEAEVVSRNLSYLPGGEALVEDVLMRINRAAEHAAAEAAPVFAAAVRELTIQDGFAILRGEPDAATRYLREQTWDALYDLYHPKIKESVDQRIVGGVSTNEAWNTLTSQWNQVAGSVMGRVAGLHPVEVDLDSYLTEMALDGLFAKLAGQEKMIREDPSARVTALLRRVFG